MPQKPSEKRFFTGGIDTDTAPFGIEAGDVLNAVNVRWLRQKGQQGASVDWIPGNSILNAVTTVLPPTGDVILLGDCVYDDTGCIYLFVHDEAGEHGIVEYNTTTDTARVVLNNSMVTGGLGWSADMYISCHAVDGLLLWCQGNTDQRYVNLATDYQAIAPISAGQLTLSQEPGLVPPTQTRQSISGATSTIQYTPLQFSYRIINSDGITSVLSPYSDTALPTRTSDAQTLATTGNAVTVVIPVAQSIPSNWKRVELIARFLDSNVFYVIRRWDANVNADVVSVGNHNAGTTPLTLTNWTGATLETIDEATAAKQFDLTPINPQVQLPVANRNMLANFYEGYDTPPPVSVTTSQHTFVPNAPSPTGYSVSMIVVNQKSTRWWYFAIVVRISNVNYLLPKECSIGRFYNDNNFLGPTGAAASTYYSSHIENGLFNLPLYISRENLIQLKEQNDPYLGTTGPYTIATPLTAKAARVNIIVEANGLTAFEAEDDGSNGNWYSLDWNKGGTGGGGAPNQVLFENTPDERGPAQESRAFLPVAYNVGVEYSDILGRKAGRVNIATLNPAPYLVSAPQYTEKLTVTMPGGAQANIPDWAVSYALTLTNAQQAVRFGNFFGGIVKATFRDGTGAIVYRDPSALLSTPAGLTIYGISIPIPNTYPYAYSAGDQMIWSVGSHSGTAAVIAVENGHIIIQFTNDGVMHTLCDGWSKDIRYYTQPSIDVRNAFLADTNIAQPKVSFFLLSGIQTSDNQYEVGTAFGAINGGAGNKSFGSFYTTGSSTATIYGDAHTQVRTSDSGGGTGLAMSPREDTRTKAGTLVWVNDLGRIAPTDSVGRKRLVNAVRFSNVRIPGAVINGYGSFDAADYKTTDITAGPIRFLALTTRGAQDGGQMLVLCEHGSFAALIGQQQIAGADGQNAFTAATGVIGDFNALRGQWGCQSPRSVTDYEGKVWWVDAYKRAVIEFNESGAGNISLFKTARLWDKLLGSVTDPLQISAGADGFTGNVLVSLPTVAVAPEDMQGFESTPDASDAVNGSVGTFAYDYTQNRWVGGYTSGARFIRCGAQVYGWKNGRLWREFSSAAGTYYGEAKTALIAVPFNQPTGVIKSPATLKLLCSAAPDTTRILSGTGAASVTPYRAFESYKIAPIMRNRVGRGATTTAAFNANGIVGFKLTGDVITAVLYWNGGQPIKLSNATLDYEVSSGH